MQKLILSLLLYSLSISANDTIQKLYQLDKQLDKLIVENNIPIAILTKEKEEIKLYINAYKSENNNAH